MSEPAPSPAPAPAPAPSLAPDPQLAAPPAADRPAYIPEQFWDGDAKAVKADEFGAHYTGLVASAAKLAERAAAVPGKPEEYKIELKLPDDVKLPDGAKFDPAKDPRLPQFLKVAHGLGLSNIEVNNLVALDAQLAIAEHAAETARIAAETKKLGEKATDRIAAVKNWAKALPDISDEERSEIHAIASSAAGVTVLEKLMAKINGGIPGHQPSPPDKPQQQSITERWYGPNSQQKAS